MPLFIDPFLLFNSTHPEYQNLHKEIFDVSPETNAGRGPVDFKISRSAHDKTLVEFKLASSTKLAQNLQKQVEIYKKAHDTDKAIKVILFFSAEEEARARKIIADIGLSNEKYIVLIDARSDNKILRNLLIEMGGILILLLSLTIWRVFEQKLQSVKNLLIGKKYFSIHGLSLTGKTL